LATKSVTLTSPNPSLLLLNAQALVLTPNKQVGRDRKVVLECPRCCWIFEAKKPDSRHPNCTFSKPEAGKVHDDVIEEPRVCRNPKCKKQFTLYWYKPATQAKK
jgi:hypothetical protein